MFRRTLNSGVEVPMLDYGVFQTPPEETERCVTEAFDISYRLINTAQAYDDEKNVGAAVRASGIPRGEVFITSKIWVTNVNYEWAATPIDESLRRLDTDYIDLVLLHQAMGDYPGAYRAMEDVYRAGKLRAIGVFNFYPEHLIGVTLLAKIPPAIDQIETHPLHQQDTAHEVITEFDVAHGAWTPFTKGRSDVFANPVLTRTGKEHGKKPGQVILRALMQKDVIVIPKMTYRNHMEENFDVFDFELYAEDLAAFVALDDDSLPCIFDHYDPKTITWMLRDYVKNNQLGGGTLY